MNRLAELYRALSFNQFLRIVYLRVMQQISWQGDVFFSQTGEDVLISYFLPGTRGFYVDIGCNHPVALSNTFRLYLSGWRGIAVDANETILMEYKKVRRQDIALCCAVSDVETTARFYKSKTSAVSTLDSATYSSWKERWQFDEADAIDIETTTLNHILETHLPVNQRIDLLTIDVEGHELQALKGLNFEKYRPYLIVIEIHELQLTQVNSNPIYNYLTVRGYELRGYITMNAYFIDNYS